MLFFHASGDACCNHNYHIADDDLPARTYQSQGKSQGVRLQEQFEADLLAAQSDRRYLERIKKK